MGGGGRLFTSSSQGSEVNGQSKTSEHLLKSWAVFMVSSFHKREGVFGKVAVSL